VLNTRRDKFKDVRVREALGLALDYEWMNRQMFYNAYQRVQRPVWQYRLSGQWCARCPQELALIGALAQTIAGSGIWAHGGGTPHRWRLVLRDNLRKAQALLKEAGWECVMALCAMPEARRWNWSTWTAMKRAPGGDALGRATWKNWVQLRFRPVDLRAVPAALQKFEFDITSLAYQGTHNPGQEYADLFGSKAAATGRFGQPHRRQTPGGGCPDWPDDRRQHARPTCCGLPRAGARDCHSHLLIPQWTAGTHRMAYNAWRWPARTHAAVPRAKPGPLTPGGPDRCAGKAWGGPCAYILKRLLLMVPTLLGVLLLTFVVIQFVPGGPVEQYLAEAKAGSGTAVPKGRPELPRRAGRGPQTHGADQGAVRL
jgi:microcin C transport system substrate-binding protein